MRAWLVVLLLPLSLYSTRADDLASIEGQVVSTLAGIPLRKATITANRDNDGVVAGGRSSYSVETDASGHFSITGMEAGTYRLRAEHSGYATMRYNARSPRGRGTALDVGRGQKLTGVDFRLKCRFRRAAR